MQPKHVISILASEQYSSAKQNQYSQNTYPINQYKNSSSKQFIKQEQKLESLDSNCTNSMLDNPNSNQANSLIQSIQKKFNLLFVDNYKVANSQTTMNNANNNSSNPFNAYNMTFIQNNLNTKNQNREPNTHPFKLKQQKQSQVNRNINIVNNNPLLQILQLDHQNINTAATTAKQKSRQNQSQPWGSQHERMHLHQLDASQYQTPSKSIKQKSVLQQINKMQGFYLQRLKKLQYKVYHLENQNDQLKKRLQDLMIQNQRYEKQLQQFHNNNQILLERTIQQYEEVLIKRFGQEASQFYTKTQKQIQNLRKQLEHERTVRKSIQEQYLQTRQERDNIEMFYRNLVQNHRRLLKADIQKTKFDLYNKPSYCNSIGESNMVFGQQKIQRKISQQQEMSESSLRRQIQDVRNKTKQLKEKGNIKKKLKKDQGNSSKGSGRFKGH